MKARRIKITKKGQVTSLLYAIVFTSLMIGGFMIFMNEAKEGYTATYDNSSLVALNQMERVDNLTKDIQQSATQISEREGALDLIGSLFTAGYQTLLLTLESLNIFSTMADIAIAGLGLGAFGTQIKIALVTMVVIAIVIGVLLATVLKKEL